MATSGTGFNPHPGSLPGGTRAIAPFVMTPISQFQPTPGIAPGWNVMATRKAPFGGKFQPTPGIAPGWNSPGPAHSRSTSGFNPHPGSLPGGTRARRPDPEGIEVSTHTRDRSRVERRVPRWIHGARDDVSTHTRDRSRVWVETSS